MIDTSLDHLEPLLNRLSEEQLHALSRIIVERIRLYHKTADLKQMARFNLMDTVYFTHGNEKIVGTVMKLNRRSISIITEDGRKWNVAPAFLARVFSQ